MSTAAPSAKLGSDAGAGVAVHDVVPSSRAYWANPRPQPGGVIVEVNRQPVGSVAEWNAVAGELDEEAGVVLTLWRDGRTFFVALP